MSSTHVEIHKHKNTTKPYGLPVESAPFRLSSMILSIIALIDGKPNLIFLPFTQHAYITNNFVCCVLLTDELIRNLQQHQLSKGNEENK